MKIRPIVAWYDLWVGAFWDRDRRRLYLLPLPCIGVVLDFGPVYSGDAFWDAINDMDSEP